MVLPQHQASQENPKHSTLYTKRDGRKMQHMREQNPRNRLTASATVCTAAQHSEQ